MQRIIITVILILSFNITFSQDTLSLNSLQDQINKLKIENQSLKYNVTILDNANTKFLTVTYATIGFCLMLILALSIWNGYVNVRLDKKRFENFTKEFRAEVFNKIINDIDIKVENKINSKLSDLSNELKLLKQTYLQLHILTLKRTNKLLSKIEITDDFEVSIEYLKLSNNLYKANNIHTFELSQALNNIKELLIKDKDWINSQIDEISKILPEIDKDFERYINEIKSIIKIN
ncbi:MAG: hypothetical protein H8E34_01155 [Bacteroidetes bacterium]|nr:hypothetical protein [Bacteroidota bacterium]